MNSVQLLVRDVEAVVGGRDSSRRMDMLRNITNLFLEQAPQLNEEHVSLFDEVIVRLAEEIDHRARVDLARQLAVGDKAPRKTIRNLALDQDIAVAGPVLSGSTLVGSDELWTVVKERGQDHLRAVAGRADLEPGVTDVLLERGDEAVLSTLLANRNARYSVQGRVKLDEFHKDSGAFGAKTTEQSTSLIASTKPSPLGPNPLGDAVAGAASHIHLLAARGELDEAAILNLLQTEQTAEALAGLALLSELPAIVVIRAYGAPQPDPLMFVVRALNFSWELCRCLLQGRDGDEIESDVLSSLRASFDALSIPTAQRVLRFVALRARADQSATTAELQ